MTDCPLCSTELQRINVAPCFDCGHLPTELEHLAQGQHEYHVFEIWGHEIVLCDFCDADFGSYFPEYWGMPQGPHPDYPLRLICKLDNLGISQDLYCGSCNRRLAFLLFRQHVLAHNAA
ncbi:hypothetical protein [Luteimonas saliphila]|uniref:hypothetical protein n=1 Tax=Luteimonas saliphila TaxID=2804919 RepID=UPI00192DF7F3|nr:hypothetical protein [Luteimonas saliphila]